LKAFDFWQTFEPNANTTELIQILTAAYNFEREILLHCEQRRLSHVVLAIDHGHVQVPGLGQMEGRAFYLIFEMAEGDVRCQIDATKRLNLLWCMRALKDVSLGLWQIHREMIAHQDIKPSNVLNFGSRGFKVADFGRSSRRGHSIWYDSNHVACDQTYAPPEQLYGHIHTDFVPRRLGCDLYMLGNLAAFLFSGVNMTANLFAKLDQQHHPAAWNADYKEVLPYLQNAFISVLEDLEVLVDEMVRAEVIPFISELCNPGLSRRGHPKGLGKYDQYSLQRYVTNLDLGTKRLEVNLRIKRISI
jgi:serine/threonine protein kinase